MKRLIRKILREELNKSDRHYRRLDIISDHVHLPYFKSMEGLTIYDKDDQLYIMKKILGVDIRIEPHGIFYYGNKIYHEYSDGSWEKWGYDDNGNILYYEDDDGKWEKYEYDDNGNLIYKGISNGWSARFEYDDKGNKIYYENSDGDWIKYEYDDRGNQIYREHSNGYWEKYEYDDKGNMLYSENSNGEIIDKKL